MLEPTLRDDRSTPSGTFRLGVWSLTDATAPVILNVDGNEKKRALTSGILRREGFAVEEASTGAEAIRKAQDGPKLIVLNLTLLDIDGFEVCRRLKADPETEPISILHVSSGLVDSEVRARCLEIGAEACVSLSAEPGEFLATVRAVLRSKRTEEQSLKLASQWQTAFEAISDGICLLDIAGRLVRWNSSLERVAGVPPSRLQGMLWIDLLGEEHSAACSDLVINVRRSGRVGCREMRLGDRWLECCLQPIPDGTSYAGAVLILKEITLRKHSEAVLRESEERFRMLADSAPVMIWMTDREGRCTFLSRKALEFYGIAATEIKQDERWMSVLHPEDIDSFLQVWRRAYVERKGFRVETRYLRFDGEYRWLMVTGTPRFSGSGEFEGFVGSSVDVTEFKDYQEMLRMREHDLAEANLLLEMRNREVERANRAKSRFLANMSHEFRTPLNAMNGFAELLLSGDPGGLTPKQRRFLGHIQTSAHHLLTLINDVVDLSRVEAGQLALSKEQFEIQAAVEEVLAALAPIAAAKGVQLSAIPTPSLEVSGDRLRIHQILVNLVNNAIKFTPEGGRVWVETRLAQPFIETSVNDTGIGVASHEQSTIFEEFYQGNGNSGQKEGSGLGLTIARRLIASHGGTIWVESEPGSGSRFVFTIPAAQTTIAARASSSESSI